MENQRERHRRFGARRHLSSASGPHSQSSSEFRYSQTLEFSAVASERSINRPTFRRISENWEDDIRQNFDFSHDRGNDRSPVPKYQNINRPKASGRSISTPGSSIISTTASSLGVTDEVLGKVERLPSCHFGCRTDGFIPPKKQSDFLANLTKKNTLSNRGPGTKLKLHAYSSLEDASAPPQTNVDISTAPTESSGWVNAREKHSVSKRRISLGLTEKRLKADTARKMSSPVKSNYALRDRNKPKLFGSPTSTQATMLQNQTLARLGKRKLNTEGSAAKPIALDSDSEPDVEEQQPVNRVGSAPNSGDEGVSDTRSAVIIEDTEEQVAEDEPEDMAVHVVAQIRTCDVIIGFFQCVADLFFQNDQMYMKNIRGKYEDWPFSRSMVLEYKSLRDVRLFDVSTLAKTSALFNLGEASCMEQLLEEGSFFAVKWPLLSEESTHPVLEIIYDPMDSDVAKSYMVFRPTDEASGDSVDDIKDILRGYTDINMIENKEQAKEYLQALIKDPFSLKPYWSSRGQDSPEAERASESDEESTSGSMTVLKYPLPPCTTDVVTIIRRDVLRLKPRRYLNDNIIDYYFKRLVLETYRHDTLVQDKVLFLSSHFYSRLCAGKGTTAGTRMEDGYKNVSTWFARSNLFHRSIIFIPINIDVHWSLAIILNPGVAGMDPGDEEAFSCIAVLDPLGSYHSKAAIVRNLRAYVASNSRVESFYFHVNFRLPRSFLRLQWENSQERSSDGKAEAAAEYGVDRVLTLNVQTPLQENSYDCGVYVLKYADVVLKKCLELGLLAQKDGVISKEVTDSRLEALITSRAFSAEDITATRKQIQEDIERDALAYQGRQTGNVKL
ncbi:hypothetical protein PsorP6_012766 [Peronosclerospora sorghi]|uniref:Uncharacterized protein n=1 Tax=Peronosclerospora sorghi TaxID=230839 RepID=A0ACC0WJR9_9STRA|nr:hypothetical protein PsorP6_012766 [Peronosclerospora sorghi]